MRRGNEKGGEYLTQLEIGANPCLSIVRDAVYVSCSQKMLTSGKAGTWEGCTPNLLPRTRDRKKNQRTEG